MRRWPSVRLSAFAPLAVILLCGLLAGLYGPPVEYSAAASPQDDLQDSLKSFTRAYELVEKNFADRLDADRTIYQGAIPGMLLTLDPHSNFLDPQNYKLLQQDQRGQYYGVGMEIDMDGSATFVAEPFVGSPAWKAGLKRGDIIVAVDGKNTENLRSPEIADLLKGPKGTQVKVTVRRQGVSEPLRFVIARGEISRSAVSGFWLRPGVAFLRISSFNNQHTSAEVEQKLRELGENDVTGLVLDLRGNQGGLVSEAVAVAGRFLQRGQIVVSHRGRASAEQVFRAKGRTAPHKYPIVVLVDRFSASAAEIVAGALQDHDRAWVLGENTFGKGLVQAPFPLSENSALLLTIGRYYTPSGRLIQRDYAHRSFFDYYSHREGETHDTRDVKMTDSGRTVYGGGGITPDEKYTPPKWNVFQLRLERRRTVFLKFVSRYLAAHPESRSKDWTANADVLKQFQEYLAQAKIPFTSDEFDQNREWTGKKLRLEMLTRAVSRDHSERAALETDSEVLKAITSLPTAQTLLEEVRRAMARRARAANP